MHTTNLRNQFHILRIQITVLLFLLLSAAAWAQSEAPQTVNLPKFNNRKIHYGAIFGFHSLSYNLKYSEAFLNDPSLDGLHSINPKNKFGITMGFIFSYKLVDNLNLRLNSQVAIYEHEVEFRYFDGARQTNDLQLIEAVNAEFPLLLEFKSRRRQNVQAYLVGGLTPSWQASGRRKQEGVQEILLTKGSNLSVEYGFGFDFFYPYFKFSPELRFSHGIINVLEQQNNRYSRGIQRLNTHSITLYLQFAG